VLRQVGRRCASEPFAQVCPCASRAGRSDAAQRPVLPGQLRRGYRVRSDDTSAPRLRLESPRHARRRSPCRHSRRMTSSLARDAGEAGRADRRARAKAASQQVETGHPAFVGQYGTTVVPGHGGPCIKVVFPLPNGNAIIVLRPQAEPDGRFSLRSPSLLPRRQAFHGRRRQERADLRSASDA